MNAKIHISRLAFIQGNSHYGRGNSPSQVKEMAEFEKWATEEERELNPDEPKDDNDRSS